MLHYHHSHVQPRPHTLATARLLLPQNGTPFCQRASSRAAASCRAPNWGKGRVRSKRLGLGFFGLAAYIPGPPPEPHPAPPAGPRAAPPHSRARNSPVAFVAPVPQPLASAQVQPAPRDQLDDNPPSSFGASWTATDPATVAETHWPGPSVNRKCPCGPLPPLWGKGWGWGVHGAPPQLSSELGISPTPMFAERTSRLCCLLLLHQDWE